MLKAFSFSYLLDRTPAVRYVCLTKAKRVQRGELCSICSTNSYNLKTETQLPVRSNEASVLDIFSSASLTKSRESDVQEWQQMQYTSLHHQFLNLVIQTCLPLLYPKIYPHPESRSSSPYSISSLLFCSSFHPFPLHRFSVNHLLYQGIVFIRELSL